MFIYVCKMNDEDFYNLLVGIWIWCLFLIFYNEDWYNLWIDKFICVVFFVMSFWRLWIVIWYILYVIKLLWMFGVVVSVIKY